MQREKRDDSGTQTLNKSQNDADENHPEKNIISNQMNHGPSGRHFKMLQARLNDMQQPFLHHLDFKHENLNFKKTRKDKAHNGKD